MDTVPNEILSLLPNLMPVSSIGRLSRTCTLFWIICRPALNNLFDLKFRDALKYIDDAFTMKSYMAVTKLGQKYCDDTGFGFWDTHRLSLITYLHARPDYYYVKHNKVWNKRLFGDPDK